LAARLKGGVEGKKSKKERRCQAKSKINNKKTKGCNQRSEGTLDGGERQTTSKAPRKAQQKKTDGTGGTHKSRLFKEKLNPPKKRTIHPRIEIGVRKYLKLKSKNRPKSPEPQEGGGSGEDGLSVNWTSLLRVARTKTVESTIKQYREGKRTTTRKRDKGRGK